MEGSTRTPIFKLLIVLAAALIVAGVALVIEQAKPVQAAPAPIPLAQGSNNASCLGCHAGADQFQVLPNGDQLPITVDPAGYGASVHADFACQTCHTDITEYPHPENPGVESQRDYVIMYRESCKTCHGEQYEATLDSMHYEVFLAGNENAPMCSDCHNPHTQQKLTDENGVLQISERSRISETCATCHNAIYEEYTQGVHGEQVLAGNPDVPTCIDCHGVHNIPDPRTAEFRLSSVNLCADCHTDATIMNQYGLSTRVLDTYIDDFHGKTITLFEQREPGQYPNTPVCYDCHGVHRIISVSDPQEGLQVKENLLATCQKCHPDATANFPTSWLGHYVPDQQRYPIVYWVTVFYRFFIPAVLGVMAVFVASDIYRRVRVRNTGNKETHSTDESKK
jgi:nitrate/TMAO reductase-like tetraheme cytochrome c subunit